MKKKDIRKKVCECLEKVVKESVGRSIPVIYHEPKVPECLKKNK